MLQRLAGKPPGYLARRALREAGRFVRSGLFRRRLRRLTLERLARATGCASLASFWRDIASQNFLYGDSDRELLRRFYHESCSDARQSLQKCLRSILSHEFDLLGSGPTQLGAKIDWHLDFKSGRRWDLTPSHKIDYAELDRPSDVKVAWELSRGHHFVTLGQAWLVDRDERALAEFESQIRSWISSNPVGYGIHWTCTMEVGVRAVNWIWALALLADAPCHDEFLGEVLTTLYLHGLWIHENLEIAHINGNHYIADALGLVACGALFRSLPEGRRWLEQGWRILEQEIRLQVEDDGVDIEASVPYHRLGLEIFLTGARFLQSAGCAPSETYWQKIEKMIEFVHAYTLPDGSSPVIGDADDGRVLLFDEVPIRDHRYLLSTGCALFGRAGWKRRAAKFWMDSLWFLGPSSLEKYEKLPAETDAGSAAFRSAGFYVLRSPDQYLFVDAGPVGFKGLGGHGHNDCLSFEWHARGRPVLTDSGLFVYTASPEWRDRFRSTAFHNTIRVDGEELNHFLSPPTLWFLGNDAQPIEVQYRHEDEREFLHAGHTGYRRLSDPVTVFRTFELDRNSPLLHLTDRLEGSFEHVVEFFFHAAPGAKLQFRGERAFAFLWPSGFAAHIECRSGPPVDFSEREGWFAPSYGIRVSRPVCVASVRTRLPLELAWTMGIEGG